MKQKLLALLALVLTVCLTLCACSFVDLSKDSNGGSKLEKPLTDAERIVGQWMGTIACDGYLSDVLTDTMGQELSGYFNFDDIGFAMTLSFDGNGGYTLALDQDSLDAFAEEVLDVMMSGLRIYLEDALSSVLGEQTLDEYLAANGTDFDQLMVSSGVDTDALAEEMLSGFEDASTEGKYTIADGKLTLDEDVHTYKLNGDRLTIEAPEGVEDEMVELLFPMVLERID